MSRYIDANELISAMYYYEHNEGGLTAYDAQDIINKAPSIDIVRCKECKWVRYCETEDLDLYLDCDKPDGGGIPRNEEWFCADGERREP